MADRYYIPREAAGKIRSAYDKADTTCSSHATTYEDLRDALHDILSSINDNIWSTPIPDDAASEADLLEEKLDPSHRAGMGT